MGAAAVTNRLVEASEMRLSGRQKEVFAFLEKRRRADPDDFSVRLAHAIAHLPIIYEAQDQIAAARAAYGAELLSLYDDLRRATAAQIQAARQELGTGLPFFLSYQGENDRDLQSLFGDVAVQLWGDSEEAPTPPSPFGRRLKIGFASRFLNFHSVYKLFQGWIRGLDRRDFEVCLFVLRDHPDDYCRSLCASVDLWRMGDVRPDRWVEEIRSHRLDVLIFPEVGMDPISMRLACHRLAPRQMMAWGHPQTSGLATMDVFLSSDLMEPEDGDEHYTESLVRLPNLSLVDCVSLPEALALSRSDLRVSASAVLYLSCQSLFKHLPQHDDVFTRIAHAVPEAVFVFLASPQGLPAQMFSNRLKLAFERAGLAFSKHVRFVLPVPFENFVGLLKSCDVYLDSLSWSGGNTTLEAVLSGLPVVTSPGAVMRARHSSAILQHIGCGDHVSSSIEAYVQRAVALADKDLRQNSRSEVIQGSPRLQLDPAPLEALANLLSC